MKAGAVGPAAKNTMSKSHGGGALPQIQVKGGSLHHLDDRGESALAGLAETDQVRLLQTGSDKL